MAPQATPQNTVAPLGAPALPSAGIAEIGLFAGCPELIGSPFAYAREEEVYGEGEDTEYVYKIVSGAVRTCKILGDGRRQIHGFHLPGDLFGFEPGQAHRLTAEAVADTKVLMFKRRQLERLATQNVEVACQLWTMTARNLQHAEEHMILLGRRTALERVAAFVLEMDSRLGGTGSIELPMSRRDIADYLGLTLETVSRSMSQLQTDRSLSLSGARRVVLNKRAIRGLVEN